MARCRSSQAALVGESEGLSGIIMSRISCQTMVGEHRMRDVLKQGNPFSDFELPDQDGGLVRLSAYING